MLRNKHLPTGLKQRIELSDRLLRVRHRAQHTDADDGVKHGQLVGDGYALPSERREKLRGHDAAGEDGVFVAEAFGSGAGAQLGVEAEAGLGAVDGLDGWGAQERHLRPCAGADV